MRMFFWLNLLFLVPASAFAQSRPDMGPSTSTIGNAPIAGNTTEVLPSDSGKPLPAAVGTTDTPSNDAIYYIAPGTGAVALTVNSKLSQIINAADFGLVSDNCATDATGPLRAAIAAAAGKKLVIPAGTFCLNTASSTLQITSPIEIEGQGTAGTLIKWNAPFGTNYAPTIDVLADNVTVHDLAFDGNSVNDNYLDSVYYGGVVTSPMTPWGEVAFVIEGNNFTGYNLKVRRAFNNCIGIGKITADGKKPIFGSPRNVNLNNIYTEYCGNGIAAANQPIPGHNGFGVDNGSGSYVNISNVIDRQSFANFGNDLNAGAGVNWTNAWGYFARRDPAHTAAVPASGFGFYNGSAGGMFNNINIISPDTFGVLAGASASQTSWNNITVRGAGRQCLIIGATSSNWNNVECESPSKALAGGYAAVRIRNDEVTCDEHRRNCQPLPISNLRMNNLVIEGATNTRAQQNAPPTWSYAIETTGGPHNVTGIINMNKASGEKGPTAFNIDPAVTGLQINHKEALTHSFGDPMIDSLSPYSFAFGGLTNVKSTGQNASWQSAGFGDVANNGSLFVSDTAIPAKRLAFGWDPVNNISVVQSIQAHVAPQPLALNPSGGNVYLGQQTLTPASVAGFPYMGSIAGKPTGTPPAISGMAPFTFDATNRNLNIYSGDWLRIPTVAASAADMWEGTANRLVQPPSVNAADAPVTLNDDLHVVLNFSTGKNYSLHLTLPVTNLDNPLNVVPGRTGFIRISQDATGGRSVAFGNAFKFPGGIPCVVASAPNAISYIRWSAFSSTELSTACDLDVR
ncbi:hypothetical protein [Phyllobacterium myrsinacearum]|uniref:Pectate lyase superfamily protein domain-containing protein n=1 Tax=Phyllobacterium myrsinacearum TaxID=28101 RepID=A0A839EI07_9HYPH|nr:hypothetical protein [Phyllobacterium myrsinacearum]MBA8877184.1 hypothetical protein [Phyllobacterium myrsinacearum]